MPRDLRFPFGVADYLAWVQPAGARVYLIFAEPDTGKTLGVVFRRDQPGSGGGESPAGMCEWCHAVRAGDGVKLLTATASSKRRVGISLCSDLSCKQKALAEPGVDDMPVPGLSDRDRIRKITQRMAAFARRNLF